MLNMVQPCLSSLRGRVHGRWRRGRKCTCERLPPNVACLCGSLFSECRVRSRVRSVICTFVIFVIFSRSGTWRQSQAKITSQRNFWTRSPWSLVHANEREFSLMLGLVGQMRGVLYHCRTRVARQITTQWVAWKEERPTCWSTTCSTLVCFEF